MKNLSTLAIIIFTIVLTIGAITLALVRGIKEGNAIRRYGNYMKSLKAEGKYNDWQKENNVLLIALKIARYGAPIGILMCIAQALLTSGDISLWLLLFTLICFIATPIITSLLHKKVPADAK